MTHKITDETRKQVEAAAGFGLRQDKICVLIGVTEKTLRKRYRRELDQGIAKAHFNVGNKLYERCMAGSDRAIEWYTKTQMGFRETVQVATPTGERFDSGPGEPELIGAYYARLERIAAERRGDTGPDPRVDPPGQGTDGSEGGEDPSAG